MLLVNGEELTIERIEKVFAQYRIPQYMADGTYNYLHYGVKPGSFLSAVICNDLRGAVENADDNNGRCLVNWVKFFYNHCPAGSWGSLETMKKWQEERRTICESTMR